MKSALVTNKHKSKSKSSKSRTKASASRVRLLMPALAETRYHDLSKNKDLESGDPKMSSSPPVSAAQLKDPSGNTRTDFEIAYKISKATDSVAAKQLATILYRNDIAQTTSHLAQNNADLNEMIDLAQEQVQKVKKMEVNWRTCLPSTTEDYYTEMIEAKKPTHVTRESAKHFEDMRMEYEKVVVYFKCIDQLKAERSELLEDQKFMREHVL